MKSNLFIFLTGTFFILFLVACSNDDNPGEGVSEGNFTITWKLDGVANDAEPNVCAFLDNTLNLGLVGSDNIQLQINNLTTTGTYELGTNDAVILMDNGSGSSNSLGSNLGAIIVTELSSSKAKGTFSGTFYRITDFNMTEPFQVTEGKFMANF